MNWGQFYGETWRRKNTEKWRQRELVARKMMGWKLEKLPRGWGADDWRWVDTRTVLFGFERFSGGWFLSD